MEHDLRFYAIICILAILSIASIMTINIYLIIFSLAVSSILIVFYRLHYLVDSVIFRRSNLVQLVGECELSGDRNAAIRRTGSRFCATTASFLTGASEPIERSRMENLIANSHCPFRFVVQVERVDLNKLLDRLQTRRSMKEIEINRIENSGIKKDSARIAVLRRELEQLIQDIEKASSGGFPLRVSQYILTSAISDNRFAAQERARSQIRELSSQFGALLGSRPEILTGNDLARILEFDSTML